MQSENKYPEKLWLGDITHTSHQISMVYGLDDFRFTCSIWLSKEIDILQLQSKFSKEYFQKVLFHIMCFQANKLCSLKPRTLDLGKYEKYWTSDLQKIWRQILFRVMGQWRYTHNVPDYRGPQIIRNSNVQQLKIPPIEVEVGKINNLSFFGGGKDSLASTTLLDHMNEDYEILTYTNSIYGKAGKQIKIIQGLIQKAVSKQYSYVYVYDDFVNCPILDIEKTNIKELFAAQTPSSIFLSTIHALHKGYTSIIRGHQKSADKGNLIWNGQDINHQWGKSTEGEKLIRQYIQKQLVSNLTYYSILKPLYDTGIILITSTREQYIDLTHSCNVDKPWCKKCSKCCYVWCLYMAYMDINVINKMFGNVNLLDLPENYQHFRELLGLEEHTPFECVGRPEQVRICFELMRIKGVSGLAMKDFDTLQREDYIKLFEQFSSIDDSYDGIPERIRQKYYQELKKIVGEKKKHIIELLHAGSMV